MTKTIPKASFTRAVNVICPKNYNPSSKSQWRPMLTNNPAFDRDAESEVFNSDRMIESYLETLRSKSRKASPETIREQNNERVALAFRVHTHTFELLQKALETIHKLPKVKDAAGDRERATEQIKLFQIQLSDLKITLETVIQYARENEVKRDEVYAVIDNLEDKIDVIAYDALDLRNRTIRYSHSAKRATTSDKIIERLESNQQKFRSQQSAEFPPPDYEGSWTPKLIAEWFGLSENVVRDRARQLTFRKPSNHAETFHPGKPGQHLKWNRPQTEWLVKYIRGTTQLGKRGRLR